MDSYFLLTDLRLWIPKSDHDRIAISFLLTIQMLRKSRPNHLPVWLTLDEFEQEKA
jgi:hypothetical protein